MEEIHYIYTDNNFFRQLVKRDNEKLWDSFYDSLIQIFPSLNNGLYRQIFTCFSLLEAIAEGKMRTQYTPKLNLNKFLLCKSDTLSEDSLEDNESEYQTLGTQLDKATLFAVNYYKSHPGLSKENLLNKIDEQLLYSTSNAAEDLIKNTLIRYKQSILNDYASFLDKISMELTWDSICSFDFFQLDKKSNHSNETFRKRLIKIKEMLLHVFHDGQVKGRDLGSFRLCEAVQRERLTSKEFIEKIESEHENKKYKISVPGMLKGEHDLCDVDVIHYATLGYYDPEFKKSFPVVVFTSDDRSVIKTRILLQLSIIRFMCKDVLGSQLKLIPGEIHFIDKKTGVVNEEPIIISEISESEHFDIKLDPLDSSSESLVEFITSTPIPDENTYNNRFIKVIEPQSFEDLLELLEMRKKDCIFRGQSRHDLPLNSHLSRELKGETCYLPRNYIPLQPLSKWKLEEMHNYHWIILKTVVPHQDITTPLDGKGCPYFQVMKYIKTNPKQEKIQNAIPNFPTPFVAFSNDVEVALYFSSCKLDFDGAIYRVVKNSIPIKYSFKESLEEMVKGKRDSPCIIDPMVGLNDVDDPKSKRQEAVYIFQRDLDLPINRYIAMEKIIIKNEFKPLIQQMLTEKGITKEFLLG